MCGCCSDTSVASSEKISRTSLTVVSTCVRRPLSVSASASAAAVRALLWSWLWAWLQAWLWAWRYGHGKP